MPGGNKYTYEIDEFRKLTDRLRTTVDDVRDKFGLNPPAPGAGNLTGEFRTTGIVWHLGLDDAQTHALVDAMESGGTPLSFSGVPVVAEVGVALVAGAGIIAFTDELGGHHGVDVNGIIGCTGLFVTPRVGGLYDELIELGRLYLSGRTVLDVVIAGLGQSPVLASSLSLPLVAAGSAVLAAGNPLGVALGIGIGWALDELLQDPPDPNDFGAVVADRQQAGDWESFLVAQVGPGSEVSLLSHRGLLTAIGGGGGGVYGNRFQVGDWERWTLVTHPGGTVSLRTHNGHYLCAENGGGTKCTADRGAVGEWETFHLVPLPNGRYALKTLRTNQFVSVQK